MATKHKKVRLAEAPTPQGNIEPRLLDSEGKPKEAPSLLALGLSLLSKFSFSIPSGASDDSESGSASASDLGGDVSFAKILLAEAVEASGEGNLLAFAKNAEATSKLLKAEAKKDLEKVEEYYLAWASGFAMSGDITLTNKKGSKLTLDRAEFERSTKALLYAMGKISNNSLFGKAGKDGKAPTPSIFKSPGKVAKVAGFESENHATHTALAEVSHVILDNGGNIQKSLELIGTLAKQAIARNAEAFVGTYRTLQGNVSDPRFKFEDWAIDRLTQGRIRGALAAMFDEQARQARRAIEQKVAYAALSAEDKRRVELFKRDIEIARNKAADESTQPKIEKIEGSNVPSPEVRATDASDPNLTLNRLKRDLAAEMAKPEISEDTSIQLRSIGRVKYLEAQIAAMETVTESSDSNEATEN